jgi:hypothetical protein
MPLHRKTRNTKRRKNNTRNYKSILRKGKRTHKRRAHRVRFLGGAAGTRWVDTNLGPMTEADQKQYQERLSPEAY